MSALPALTMLFCLICAEASAAEGSPAAHPPASPPRTSVDWLHWQALPPLPDGSSAAGAYIGTSNGALIVAGGKVVQTTAPAVENDRYSDAIFVLQPGAKSWRAAGRLLHAVAEGAAVTSRDRLICIGGRNAERVLDDVLELTWNSHTGKVDVQALPPLPQPCYRLSAAALGHTLYVASGKDDTGPVNRFWRLPAAFLDGSTLGPSSWQELPLYPAPARFGAALAAQSDGDRTCLYLIGGNDGRKQLRRMDRFDPRNLDTRRRNNEQAWQRCANLFRPSGTAAAVPWGQSHIFEFGGSIEKHPTGNNEPDNVVRRTSDVLAYHTITDTWVGVAELPEGLSAVSAVPWNHGVAVFSNQASMKRGACYWCRVQTTQRHFGVLDYLTVAGYLAAIAAIGLLCAGTNRNTSEYFLGGRRIAWWAAGLSLLATQVSSIGVMAIPAKSYATDWAYLTGVAAWFVVVPIVTNLFIPFFRRLDVTSAYEYLEARFSPALRLFGSLSYCLLQLGRMAVVLYLPALALASVTGINVIAAVIIMGALCTLYTVAGGMQAVIWTDVLQSGILMGGMLLCLAAVLLQLDGGLQQFVEVAAAHQKFQAWDLRWDAFQATLWVVLVGNVFIRLSNLTSDQAVVQRYLTTRDERQSRMALWTDVAVSLPWALLVFLLGTALFVFYREHPQLLSPTVDTDGIVPYFIAQQLPTGISGMVVAAIMAAAMSSMDSSMHSIATLLVTDFYARLRPTATDAARFRMARVVTVILGVFGTASAVVLALADVRSLWDFFQYLMGLFVGSLAGLFLLGVFTTRANSRGALVGALASAALLAYVTQSTRIHFLLYSAIGVVSCVSIGYLASMLLPGQRQTDGLTAFTSAQQN